MRFAPASALRGFLSKLHPVLPGVTTPRESQQLLSALQHSFKKQLDGIHPPVQPREDRSLDRGAGGPSETTHSAANAADSHVYSVLQHPLLAKQHRAFGSEEEVNTPLESRAVVEKFERAVAEGKVNDSVLGDFVTIYSRLTTGRPLPVTDSLGRKIAVWFTSSKPSTKADFLLSRIKGDVVPVMYADGQEQVVWEWLRLMYEEDLLQSKRQTKPGVLVGPWRRQTAFLIRVMVREQIKRQNFHAAVLEYVQAWDFMQKSGRLEIRSLMPTSTADEVVRPMGQVATMLASVIIYHRYSHRIDGTLYDAFCHVAERVNNPESYRDALLPIYHPSKPNADKLLEQLHTGRFWTLMENHMAMVDKSHPIEIARRKPRKQTIVALLDAAQVLLDQGKVKDSQCVLDKAEHRFPEYLQPRKPVECTGRISLARADVSEGYSSVNMIPG